MNARPSDVTGPALVWLRDDLRLADNPALAAATAGGRPVTVAYVLDDGPERRSLGGACRWWLHRSLTALAADLAARGVPLVIRRGDPAEVVPALAAETGAALVTWNRRYEIGARELDARVKADMVGRGVRVDSHNGHLLAEPWAVRTKAGEWFRVFTPFWKATRLVVDDGRGPLPAPEKIVAAPAIPSLKVDDLRLAPRAPDWSGGLAATWTPGEAGARARLAAFLDGRLVRYAAARDFPDAAATSELSPHLRFGEISIRTVYEASRTHAVATGVAERTLAKFQAELGWREFSYHLLYHFPDLPRRNFQTRFDAFPWREPDPAAIAAWRHGETGYPVVDAGMRQLWTTGTMHNRVRMIVASFLVKHLLVDWRIGEDWFWDTLCDADPANNAAGWQWVAGSGADAAPYFRVFNPVLQGEKFDPDGRYVRRFVPELADLPREVVHRPWQCDAVKPGGRGRRSYPAPIVDHAAARERALGAFSALKAGA